MRGYVYVISNPAMPNIVKIGFSTKDPILRAQELGTGSPFSYQVEYDILIENPQSVEKEAHQTLAFANTGKEWFSCSVDIAIRAIKHACKDKVILHENHPSNSENSTVNQDYITDKVNKETPKVQTKPDNSVVKIKKNIQPVTQLPESQSQIEHTASPINYGNIAFEDLKLVATAGDAEAQYQLGYRFDKGIGTRIKLKDSFFWYEKAAKQQHEAAMLATAQAYLKGRGVEAQYLDDENFIVADYIFPLLNKNNPVAQFLVAKWCFYYTHDKKPSKTNKANRFFARYNIIIEGGDIGKFRLKLLELSANQNYSKALRELGDDYKYKEEIKNHETIAFNFYLRAANNGDDAISMRYVAVSYIYATGCKKNLKEAKRWMQKAAEAGDRSAKEWLENWSYTISYKD